VMIVSPKQYNNLKYDPSRWQKFVGDHGTYKTSNYSFGWKPL
jgi:hypothetical protein